MKKIYFCGSIRGGRQDAELYFRMIAKMKERFAVLTEHIGSPELFGMEAKTLGKPTYVFYRSADKKSGLSAMIAGDSYYKLYPYSGEEELFSLLAGVMDAEA